MTTLTTLVTGLPQPRALRSRPADGTLVVGCADGTILVLDAKSGDTGTIAAVGAGLTGVDLTPDGTRIYAAGTGLGVVAVPEDGSAPTTVLTASGAILARQDVVLVLGSDGRLSTVDPTTGTVTVRDLGLTGVTALLPRDATGTLLVATVDGTLAEVDAGVTVLATGLGTLHDLAWHDTAQTHLLLAEGERVVSLPVEFPTDAPTVLADGLTDLWAARPVGDGRVVVGSGDAVLLGDLPEPEHQDVDLHVPDRTLFVGGWARVRVVVNDPGTAFDDLELTVEPQDGGELVSASRDNGFDPAAPDVVLTVGWLAGPHELVATRRSDGREVGRTRFEVLDTWTDPDLGPAVTSVGEILAGDDEGTWGGADSGDWTVPQNVEVHKAIGTRRVALVLVETSEPNAQFTTVAATTQSLMDEFVNGVPSGGQVRSVADYFLQASDGRLALEVAAPVGPIRLPGTWRTYFTRTDGKERAVSDLDATIVAQIVTLNEAAAALGDPPVVDLATVDSLVYVVASRPATATVTRRGVWPRASRNPHTRVIGSQRLPFGISLPVTRALHRLWLPEDWATAPGNGGRTMHETAVHELCHNLGLRDQYDKGYGAPVTARITGTDAPAATNPTGAAQGTWEVMAYEQDLPLPSTAHRMMLGWLPANKVKLYNFGVFGPVDEEVTLHAAGAGPVPHDEFAAAEVRIADGRNYYLEYRPTVAGRIVDQAVPEADAVVITDAVTSLPVPTDRAQLLLAQDDADAVTEQGSFVAGQDYREQDTTSPGFEQDFIVDVLATRADSADLRIRYAADQKPDPGIRPWVPSNGWRSPDFHVENARSRRDPAFENVPWEGQPNTLSVDVHNWGTSDAHQVTVRFSVKDLTLGSGAEVDLGEATAALIPRGGTVRVTAPKSWTPPSVQFFFGTVRYTQHSCVVARIAPFTDPATGLREVTPENNEVQSNFTWAASSTASPASREVTTFWAENPYPVPAVMSFSVRQPHPMFRVYLDHAWVRLEPGARRRILMMTESLLGDARFDDVSLPFLQSERRIETNVRLSMEGDDLGSCAGDTLGGAGVLVLTGRGTEFRLFEVGGGVIHGVVAEVGTGDPVSGPGVVSVVPLDEADDRPAREIDVRVEDGEFLVKIEVEDPERWAFTALYLGQVQYTPCQSETVTP